MYEIKTVVANFTPELFHSEPCTPWTSPRRSTLGAGSWLSNQAVIPAPQKPVWVASFHGSSYTRKKKNIKRARKISLWYELGDDI